MEGGTGPPSLGQSSGHSQIRAVPIASSLHGCSHRASLQDRGRVARSRVSSRPHRGGRLSPTGDPESSEPAGTGTGPTLPSTFWSCPTQILGPLTARTTAGRGRGASACLPQFAFPANALCGIFPSTPSSISSPKPATPLAQKTTLLGRGRGLLPLLSRQGYSLLFRC